jgi:hypothetical protein
MMSFSAVFISVVFKIRSSLIVKISTQSYVFHFFFNLPNYLLTTIEKNWNQKDWIISKLLLPIEIFRDLHLFRFFLLNFLCFTFETWQHFLFHSLLLYVLVEYLFYWEGLLIATLKENQQSGWRMIVDKERQHVWSMKFMQILINEAHHWLLLNV